LSRHVRLRGDEDEPRGKAALRFSGLHRTITGMESSDRHPGIERSPRTFRTTRWSVVLSAGRDSSPDSQRALESLCSSYWEPLYAYVRRRVPDVSEAQDLTQAFFVELLEKNYVGSATPQRGRFRAFLLTAFKHFLSRQWEKARAQKRGGGRAKLPLDFSTADSKYSFEPSGGLTAERLYERTWSITLLAQVMERLREEFVQAGKSDQFDELKEFLIGDHSGRTYANAAEQLQTTEAAAKMAVSRMRKRYRELLREEIAHTVDREDEIEDEIRSLFESLK
jgi:DNA-directed RNA polymerase specialized sigma24 family protein